MNVQQADQPQQDERGNWWLRRPQDGAWLWWNGQTWVIWRPPAATPSSQKTTPPGAKTRQAEAAAPSSTNRGSGQRAVDQPSTEPQPQTATARVGAQAPGRAQPRTQTHGQIKEQPSTSAAEPQTLVELLTMIGKSLLKSLPQKIIIVCAVLVGTWFVHTFLLAYVNDGFFHVRHPVLAMVLSLNRGQFGGILFWTLLSGIISTLVTTIYREGVTPLVSRLKQVPAAIGENMQSTGQFAPAILLGAGGLALFLGFTIAHRGEYVPNRMVSLLMVIALLLTLSNGFKGFVFLVTRLAWQDLRRNMAGQIKSEYNPRVVYLALAGMGLGFALATLLPFLPWTGYLGVIALLVLALLASLKKASPATLILIAFGSGLVALLCSAGEVFACYGGFHEYGGTLGDWLTRPGGNAATSMSLGVPPAMGAAIGALVPVIIGGMNLPGGATMPPPGAPPGPGGPGMPERSNEEIYNDPKRYDRYVDPNGQEYIYTIPEGDMAPNPFWVPMEDYLAEQEHLRQGRVFVNGSWMDADVAQQHQEWQQRIRRENELRHQEATQRYQEYLQRQAMKQAEAERESEWLDNLSDRIRSGRHPLSSSENKEDFLRGLEETSKHLRETGEIDAMSELKRRQVIDRMLPEMEDYMDGAHIEMERAHRSARNWDRAVWGAETVQNIADTTIDGLSVVTPGGQAVRNSYLAGRALAGGLAEGHVTGEYGRSLLEHGSASVADYVEGGPLGGKKNAVRRGIFQVGRGGVEGAYQEGVLEAYQEGKDMREVISAAGRGFVEGSAGRASELVSDHLGDTYGAGYKYIYDMGESAFQGGYEAYWEADTQFQELTQRLEAGEITEAQFEEAVKNLPTIREGVRSGTVEGALDASLDFTVSNIGERVMPDSGTITDTEFMREQLDAASVIETPEGNLGDLLADDWSRDYLRDMTNKEVRDGLQDWVKDEAKDQVIQTDIYQSIHGA